MNYIIVDTANTFFRAKHAIQSDLDSKIGMALHITLNSIRKVWQDFKGDHVVFCLEGRSWRKDFYEPYKRNRKNARDARTEKEVEEDLVFWETFDNFKEFIETKTNCTTLQNPRLEADDLSLGFCSVVQFVFVSINSLKLSNVSQNTKSSSTSFSVLASLAFFLLRL
jgi:hypothetical protein